MKTRVLRDRFKEIEIRPQKEFFEYLKLIDQDVKDIFKSSAVNFLNFVLRVLLSHLTFLFLNMVLHIESVMNVGLFI